MDHHLFLYTEPGERYLMICTDRNPSVMDVTTCHYSLIATFPKTTDKEMLKLTLKDILKVTNPWASYD